MLDIGWPELLLVAVITVVVVGPKELPRVLRAVMFWVRRAQSLAREFQSSMNDLAREADLDDIKKDINKVKKDTLEPLKPENVDKLVDPDNSIAGMFTGKAIRAPIEDSGDTKGKIESASNESDEIDSEKPKEQESTILDSSEGNDLNQTKKLSDENLAEINSENTNDTTGIDDDKSVKEPKLVPTKIGIDEVPIEIDHLPESTTLESDKSSPDNENLKQQV